MDLAREYAKADVDPNIIMQIASDFRAQPIVVGSERLDVVGLEFLNRKRLDFDNAASMLRTDIRALECASMWAHDNNKIRVHINAEVSSLLDIRWYEAMAGLMCKGIVIEIVERNDLLRSQSLLHRAKIMVAAVRRLGGQVALDDLSCTDIEIEIVNMLRPEFIKLETIDRIAAVRRISSARVIVERIESRTQGTEALAKGANELQGYWCDVCTEALVPAAFTPPGVMAQNAEKRLVAA